MMMTLNTEQLVHLASQYLAAFGISFVETQNDDSHTNLGFDPVNNTLSTRSFGKDQFKMEFYYDKFELCLFSKEKTYQFSLDGNTHREVLEWIKEKLLKIGVKEDYKYSFHYEIPFKISNEFVFHKPNKQDLDSLVLLRRLADKGIQLFLENGLWESEIRIWPHHFDTGAFFSLKKGLSMGIGLAIADEIVDQPYFYAAAYDVNGAIDVSSFSDLNIGVWMNHGFNGAILESINVSEKEVAAFFDNVLKHYLK